MAQGKFIKNNKSMKNKPKGKSPTLKNVSITKVYREKFEEKISRDLF